ncbi:MAG: hypothetical protein KDB68_14695 [Planctomycetes bacterium]|nr:hypothetical protein [Planctomycetota bacterium]
MGELQLGERLLLADGGEGVVESVQTENALLSGHGSLGTPTNEHGLFSVYNFRPKHAPEMRQSFCSAAFVWRVFRLLAVLR